MLLIFVLSRTTATERLYARSERAMNSFVQPLAHFFFALGGMGLVLLGILDSSFLMMPLGNDLLVVALTASHRTHMPY